MDDFEREEEARQSPLFTRTDRKVIFVCFAILCGISVWLFVLFREMSRFNTCQDNVREIGQAIKLYMSDNSDRLPPAFTPDGSGGVALDRAGLPRTWLTHVYPFVKERHQDVFTCLTASPDEYTHVSNPEPGKTGTIDLTYGMFTLVSTVNLSDLPSPESTALIAETCPGGHEQSVDPLPLANGNDGFLIGINDSNTDRSAKSQYVTRLAIRQDTPRDPKRDAGIARHASRGVVVLYAGLNVGVLDTKRMFLMLHEDDKDEDIRPDPAWLGPVK